MVTLPVLDSVRVESGLGDELRQPPHIHSYFLFRKPDSKFAQQAHVFSEPREATSESGHVRPREASQACRQAHDKS